MSIISIAGNIIMSVVLSCLVGVLICQVCILEEELDVSVITPCPPKISTHP